jgi:hypothetical protein
MSDDRATVDDEELNRLDGEPDGDAQEASKSLGLTPEQLKAALKVAGDHADRVLKHLTNVSQDVEPR